jgi:(p)ppGpp synthase/HD superfamily hydrolase
MQSQSDERITRKIARPAGCSELEQRLLRQVDEKIHPVIKRALAVMYHAHRDQLREEGLAYATHPLSAALIAVEELGMRDAREIVTTLLHDVLEDDFETTPAELTEKFGHEIGTAVMQLTKMYKRDGTQRQLGLKRYYDGLQTAPEWVRAVKLCDRIHNIRTLNGSGRGTTKIVSYTRETREKLLPLATETEDATLKKAGDLLLKELYR